MTLPVSRLVNVAVNLSPLPAAGRDFGRLLILGDSNVISGLERIRDYSGITGVGEDFSSTSPEFLGASLFFSQSPQPTKLSIGRWIRTATAAMLQGAILTSAQQALGLFTQITAAGFHVTIDGTVKSLTGMDFSTALNLNGVASIVTAALSASGTCVWTGSQFEIISATSGAGVHASGTITFSGQPLADDTITVNGIVITFKAASPTGNQVLIGSTADETAVNLYAFLANSVNVNIAASTYAVASGVITVTAVAVGTGGNAITLTESATNVVVSGATLTGGTNPSSVSYATAPASGTDVSTLMGLTSALALPLVPGYAAETPLAAVQALSTISNAWYGSMFAASVMPTDDQNMDICPFIEAQDVTRTFGVTIQNTNVLASTVSNDLASRMKAGGYSQCFNQYSTSSPYAVASMFGRAFSVNFAGQNTMIDLMYKQEPGIVAENLTTGEANVLQAKRCNVYVGYDNDTSILQYGVMSGPAFFDEIFGLDWFQNAVQTACFNVEYTSGTKIPQTDAGANQFVNAIGGVCDQAVGNGLSAPGVWNAAGFGQLTQGQYLKSGYYIYAQPIALQSESDRALRKAPPIQVALKLAGSIQTVDVLVNVNR
jgi:hypothetical protein